MIICGILSLWEFIVVFVLVIAFLFPTILRKLRGKRTDMTEKLDQMERLERMYRDGSLSEREFKKQKRRIMKEK